MDKNRSISSIIIGIVIMIFALVGLTATIIFCASKISDATNQTKLKSEYESFLSPFVMNDPDTFDDVTQADMQQLIEASIWSLMGESITPNKYKYSDDGSIILPQADVEKAFEDLFGTDIKPLHQTVDEFFIYDETQKTYLLPVTGVLPIYVPKVYDISGLSKITTLTVGYLRTDAWETDENGKMIEPEPSKYVKISLGEKNGKYYIISLQDTTAPEIG